MEEPWRVTAVQETRESTLPSAFALDQNYPNPFNSGTVIRFELPAGGETELAVYNLVGQKIASLVHGAREVGQYTVHWDGRDSSREPLASGWDQVETRKLLLLR